MKSEKEIVVSIQSLQSGLLGGGVIEHPANRWAIDICGLDAEADNAASEGVHDEHDPMVAQEGGFDAEQVGAPEAVLGMGEEFTSARWNLRRVAGLMRAPSLGIRWGFTNRVAGEYEAIGGVEIGRSLSGPVTDQKLMFR